MGLWRAGKRNQRNARRFGFILSFQEMSSAGGCLMSVMIFSTERLGILGGVLYCLAFQNIISQLSYNFNSGVCYDCSVFVPRPGILPVKSGKPASRIFFLHTHESRHNSYLGQATYLTAKR